MINSLWVVESDTRYSTAVAYLGRGCLERATVVLSYDRIKL